VPKLRVVAIDSAGQEGWDEHKYQIPSGDVPGTLTVTTDLGGSPFVMDEPIGDLCAVGADHYDTVVWEVSFDGDRGHIPLGSTIGDGCLQGFLSPAPFVSSDTVRYRVSMHRGQNRVSHFFSDYFTVRPDSSIGDAPPVVNMTSPVGGETFPGGGIVPILWTAIDDEELRSIDIQVSTDGARTWTFIAQDLPPLTTSFDWQLPPSAGLSDVRVRVMVRDLRFQTTSSGGDVTFAVSAGDGGDNCSLPPGEIGGVGIAGDKTMLYWSPEASAEAYDVARGLVSGLAGGQSAACLVTGLAELQHDDLELPPSGLAFYYVIRGSNACGAGGWGSGSVGQIRSACP